MKRIFLAAILVLAVAAGYSVAYFKHKPEPAVSKVKAYFAKKVKFCELNESERFKVCPVARSHRNLKSGGSVTQYKCANYKGYIETNKLSESDMVKFNFFRVRLALQGLSVTTICEAKSGKMYKVQLARSKKSGV